MTAAEKIYWIDHDGGSIDLTDEINYSVLAGVDGRWMPPFEIVTNEVYKVPGDYVRARKTKMREVTLPIAVFGTTDNTLLTKLRVLTDAFDPSVGDGKLKVVTSEGGTLLLNCHYSDGMSFPETFDTGNYLWRKFIAVFQSHDVFWWDASENDVTWGGYYSQYPQVVDNHGDVETWPIWSITGPATALSITNLTTDKSFEFTGLTALESNFDTLYVDTRRGKVSVLANHIWNYYSHLTTTSSLFSLVPGLNQLIFQITTSDETYSNLVRCRWINRYYGV